MPCLQLERDKSRPGKGAHWTIDQTVGEMFDQGNYRRRKRRPRPALQEPTDRPALTHSIDRILAL